MAQDSRPWNWVDEAIERVGGPTEAAILLHVSGATIHRMKTEGRMPTDTPEARERIRTLSATARIGIVRLTGLEDSLPPPSDHRNSKKNKEKHTWIDDVVEQSHDLVAGETGALTPLPTAVGWR
jgi:hypothetical protein